MSEKLKVLLVGCGQMGGSHGRAYHEQEGYELIGVVSRRESSAKPFFEKIGAEYPWFPSLEEALDQVQPDVVSINTYTDTHVEYAEQAFAKGCHVFMEKPIAGTLAEAERVVEAAKKAGKKLVIGYILRVHPAWKQFISLAQDLGKPLVMRMNLNQQSSGEGWEKHKRILETMSPIVDCGVHYVDVMCQMVRSKPTHVHAIGARLSDEIDEKMVNYGQLQVKFADGSVGWYEAGWGPMISETAFFVKDVVGPKGCVTIEEKKSDSNDIDSHTKTDSIRVHRSEVGADGKFAKADEFVDTGSEPDHDGLCALEQEFLYEVVTKDLDLTEHWDDALHSLQIVLAADESMRTSEVVRL